MVPSSQIFLPTFALAFYLTIAGCSTSSVDCKQLNPATANSEFAFQSSPYVHFHHSLAAPPAALEFHTTGLRSLFNHSRKSQFQLQDNAVKTRSPTLKRLKLWRSAIAVNQKAVPHKEIELCGRKPGSVSMLHLASQSRPNVLHLPQKNRNGKEKPKRQNGSVSGSMCSG